MSYRIGAGTSPAIDAGDAVSNNGGEDFWKNRLYNNGADIGAHEYYASE